MSEDYQWRQLGSIVNQVLMDTRTKAVRRGTQSKAPPPPILAKTQQGPTRAAVLKLGHGFLNPDFQASTPAQLELPFGIATPPGFHKRPEKAARLI